MTPHTSTLINQMRNVNHIGCAGRQNFGLGICPDDQLPAGMQLLPGTIDPLSDEREEILKLRHGSATNLAVAFADVVCHIVNPQELQLRLKGVSDGKRVRIYLPWPAACQELLREGVLAEIPAIDPGSVGPHRGVELHLVEKHLRLAMETNGEGTPRLRIVRRELTPAEQARDEGIVQAYVRALRDVEAHVVPVMRELGRSLSDAEMLDVAGRIFTQRARV